MGSRALITNFTAGEFSPFLERRTDVKRYYNSLQTCNNFICLPYGGLIKTPGTRYVGPLNTMSMKGRLFPFKVTRTQQYCLIFEGGRMSGATEVGGYVMFAVKASDGTYGLVADPVTPTIPYKVNSPYKEEHLAKLKSRQFKDVMYLFHPDVATQIVTRYGHQNWTVTEKVFKNGPFSSPNSFPNVYVEFSGMSGTVTLTAHGFTFAAGDVGKKLRILDGVCTIVSQSSTTASATFEKQITNGKHTTGYGAQMLGTTSVTGTVSQGVQVYYKRKYYFEYTIPSGSMSVTFTLADSDPISTTVPPALLTTVLTDPKYTETIGPLTLTGTGYIEIDMGDYMHGQLNLRSSSYPPDPDQMTMTVASTGTGTINLRQFAPSTKAQCGYNFAWQAFDATKGYAQNGHVFEGRLILAGTYEYPNGLWFSKTGDMDDFYDYDPEKDDSGMFQALESPQLESIQWIAAKRELWVGTDFGVWRVYSGESGKPITPSLIKAEPSTAYGSDEIDALYIGSAIIYVERSRNKVREIVYTLDSDDWKSSELSLFGSHLLTESYLSDYSWQQQPYSIMWFVRDDGVLCGLTYLKEQDVIAMHRHERPGVVFESVTVIQAEDGIDEVWLIGKRTIGGSVTRYVEVMERTYQSQPTYSQKQDFYVDCGLIYDGAAVGTVTGLDHLEGEEVAILADGAVMDRQTVTGGEVPIEGDGGAATASYIVVGRPYRSYGLTQNLEQPTQEGTMQGVNVKVSKTRAQLYKTGSGLYIGEDIDDPATLTEIDIREYSDAMDAAPPLFTGGVDVYSTTDFSVDSAFWFLHDAPTPCNILAFVNTWEVGF